MFVRKLPLPALTVLLFLLLSSPAWAADDGMCLGCHGSGGMLSGKLAIDEDAYQSSVHSALGCATCHAGYEEVPHRGEKKEASCGSCHSGVSGKYSASIHGKLSEMGMEGMLDCASCHGIHDVQDVESSLSSLRDPETCLSCHEDIRQSYEYSFHGTAFTNGWDAAPSCVDCHGSHQILGPGDEASTVAAANVPVTCGSCHGASEQVNWADGKEHVVPQDKEEAYPLWIVWKFFIVLILIDTLKDGPIIVLELWHKVRGKE